ncbi:cupin domain-containing protein [Ornithinimicrobium cerasi]|uniref:Cupin superfamily protein n=1 Tax=Ornithinimicrobium cerasi TaxID=2248773 RepID=A0A285VEM9_9MICO|nr:cupin domain-containing protein [Ornithinimicrobium cerasi]SOC52539.1 Cupin superfamily protein [Ornithinimicrobium cerasi]
MTQTHHLPTRAAHDRAALARLLGDLDPQTFATEYWGSRLHLASAGARGGDDFSDLFGLDAVDELVADRGLRTPFLRVARDGSTLPDRTFTSGGGIGAAVADQVSDDRLLQLFADGATIVLQGLHRTWAPVRELSAALAADLGHPVQVNAYVTPPQNQGFADHYDVHDVFVLQVHGEKRWTLRDPVHVDPLRDEPWTERRAAVEERARQDPALETTLRPGDCLYLPRGWIHAARALGGVSVHLTIGVHQWTRSHLGEALLERARAALADDPEVRRSLPLGLDLARVDALEGDVEVAREALLRAVRDLPADQVVRVLRGRARSAQRAAPVRPLAQLAAADVLDPDDTLRLRAHLMLEVLPGTGGDVVVSSRAGRFGMPSASLPGLRRLLDTEAVQVGDLADDPGEALALARLLVRRGVALVGWDG